MSRSRGKCSMWTMIEPGRASSERGQEFKRERWQTLGEVVHHGPLCAGPWRRCQNRGHGECWCGQVVPPVPVHPEPIRPQQHHLHQRGSVCDQESHGQWPQGTPAALGHCWAGAFSQHGLSVCLSWHWPRL